MFAKKIISWYLNNKRDLPWRNTDNPYYIWLSEIILQQTRVQQGLPYYEKFVENFSTVEALAAADEGEILRLWQGLGYYSRGRNLHKTAKLVVETYRGKFPDNFKDLQKLKGVGSYTAAAIASFAFSESVPAIDGNALRVISRFFEIFEPIDNPAVQKKVFEISSELMKDADAGLYNQAVMELGAMVCKPKKTLCNSCPVNVECKSFKNKTVDQIPTKAKKAKVSNRFLQYFVFEFEDRYWLKKRAENEIWANMYDFYFEEGVDLNFSNNLKECIEKYSIEVESIKEYPIVNNILTHQKQQIVFVKVICKIEPNLPNGRLYNLSEIEDLAKPKVIFDFFEKVKKS
jgi:A/G-specific adenine glycosylase